MKADLHIHTTFSDGLLTPEQVVEKAHALKIPAIAITDHDTLQGIPPALKLSKKYPLTIIPGIEISTNYKEREVHILGYYIDFKDAHFQEILVNLQKKRVKRAKMIIEKLQKLSLDISFSEIEQKSQGSSIGRPHIAEILCKKNYVKNIKEAFEKYLGKGKPAYVPRETLSPFEAIDLIKQNGGLPVLAHPGLVKNHNVVMDIIDYGLIGIEVYHKEHNYFQCKFYKKLAQKNNLIITGGSDCHGHKPLQIGKYGVDLKWVKKMHKIKNIKGFDN